MGTHLPKSLRYPRGGGGGSAEGCPGLLLPSSRWSALAMYGKTQPVTLIFTGTMGTSEQVIPTLFSIWPSYLPGKQLNGHSVCIVTTTTIIYYNYYFKGEKSLPLSRLVAVKWGAVNSTCFIPSVFSWLAFVLNSLMGRGFNDSCQRSFNCMMLMEAGKWAAVRSTIVLGEKAFEGSQVVPALKCPGWKRGRRERVLLLVQLHQRGSEELTSAEMSGRGSVRPLELCWSAAPTGTKPRAHVDHIHVWKGAPLQYSQVVSEEASVGICNYNNPFKNN